MVSSSTPGPSSRISSGSWTRTNKRLPDVFAVVDRVLRDGDEEAVSLIIHGFLVDLADEELYAGWHGGLLDFMPGLGLLARHVVRNSSWRRSTPT
jgi:hypothetical protein